MSIKTTAKDLILLNILFLIYSFTGLLLKRASQYEFLSAYFLLYFTLAVIAIAIYAIGWQQALKRVPLSNAYLNKSIVIIWGIVWSAVFFHETIDAGIIIGGIVILLGILMVVKE